MTLALCCLLGCSAGGSGSAGNTGGSSSAGAVPAEAASVAGPSATGYYGVLLPANLHPHEFTLTDQHRRGVSLRDFRGRVAILAFLYTASKTTAPLIAQQIRGALDELASESGGGGLPVAALAVSVDPSADTPAHVRAFLRENSLVGRLEYLTGTPAQLHAVWRAYAVVPASAGALAYERSAFVVLIGRDGAQRVEFPLEELTPEALAHDVRRLESE
jgi:cytochrome oxidase Cu insertion factor (SCO1/SenC/PrrC family)